MPGYELAKVDLDSLAPKYKCASCKRLLRDAMQTSCGHLYCLSCLDNLIVPEAHISTIKCLEDGTMLTLEEVFPDTFRRREISQLPVRCTFAEKGCKWKGQVKTLEDHHKDCEIQRCNSTGVQHAEVMSGRARRNQISLGEAELQAIVSDILSLVEENRELRRAIEANERRIAALEKALLVPPRPLPLTSELIPDLEAGDGCDGSAQQISSLARQLEEAQATIRRLERRVESHERLTAEQDTREAELLHQLQVSYDGTLLWKIDDFAKRRQDAISGRQNSFYSPSLYTSRHGYKMCARVYLNGDGMGQGTHISVFFTIMRGQYDALLRWPFRQKVTITLLDQENEEHVTSAFRPNPNSAAFQRPRREMNVESGCPLFCFHAELNKHAYVRDDVMFMKIIVDTSDL